MHRLLHRYRWWVVLLGVIAGFVLLRQVYFAVLPMDAWLERGWYALQNEQYRLAYYDFHRALAKKPDSPMPHLALAVLYRKASSPGTRTDPLARLPWVGKKISDSEGEWLLKHAKEFRTELQREERWQQQYFGPVWRDGAFDTLFYFFWRFDSRAVSLVVDGVHAQHQGDDARAWALFARVQSRYANTHSRMTQNRPLLLRCEAYAALHAGYQQDALRIARSIPSGTADDHGLIGNLMLSPAPGAGKIRLVNTIALQPGLHLLLPARSGAHLISYLRDGEFGIIAPTTSKGVRWQQWQGNNFVDRPAADVQGLIKALQQWRLDDGTLPVLARGSSASGPQREFIALHNRADSRVGIRTFTSIILRLDRRVTGLSGHAPEEIVCIGDELWTHEPIGLDRIGADGATTEYRNRSVTRNGRVFEAAQELPPSPVNIDPQWRPFRDGSGQLWLALWDGHAPALRAKWENGAFRPTTATEQAKITRGFADTAGRLWFNADLPAGFTRDTWRTVPGLARLPYAARYTVDARKRVWLTAGSMVAYWENGRWHSVIALLPGMQAKHQLAAAGNGVVVLSGDRVSYLE
ncbi:MAG: tetratricopeptide repeat protein [Armatimonadota bacterium]